MAAASRQSRKEIKLLKLSMNIRAYNRVPPSLVRLLSFPFDEKDAALNYLCNKTPNPRPTASSPLNTPPRTLAKMKNSLPALGKTGVREGLRSLRRVLRGALGAPVAVDG